MISGISFVLNGQVCRVSALDPTMTLLQYLRREQLLSGSKEGCGEGDCGACTVVVGELKGSSRVRYVAVNACIQFVAMLQGKSVWTVEGVRGQGDFLHPVQEAFVKTHGTQCGFCTPGFVMSLFAAYLNGASVSEDDANDLFAGNLCRCTGYGSIVKAVGNMAGQVLAPEDDERIRKDFDLIRDIRVRETVALKGRDRILYSPEQGDDLAALYAENPEATLVAGATDVGLWVTKQHRELPVLIYLGRVEELQGMTENDGRLTLGAGVTHSDAMPFLSHYIPDFEEFMRRLGATQVRNSGTVVGNIANGSPIGDMPPALIALGAQINLRRGERRRTILLEDFFIAYGQQDREPGEFIESVEIPIPDNPDAPRFYKVSKRLDQDISAVCGCFNLDIRNGVVQQARIAFGGMAETPKRAEVVEKALQGQPWTEETLTSAMSAFEKDFTPITDMRASAEYRMLVAKNLLRRYYLETTQADENFRLADMKALSA